MKKTERKELAKWVMKTAQKAGANDVSVNITNTREIEVSVRESKLEKVKESTRNYMDLSLYVDQKYSSHSTSRMEKKDLEKFIQETVAMTRYLTKDPSRTLPDRALYKGMSQKNLHISDAGYPDVQPGQRVKMAHDIEKIGKGKDKNIISVTSAYGDTFSQSVKIHSNGFEGERESTVFYAGMEVTMNNLKGGRTQDWFYGVSRYHKDLPDPERIAEEAVSRASRKIGQKKFKSGIYDMVVENRSASRLVGAFYGPLRARSIQQKSSYLDGKLGKQVGSEAFTLIDDPFIPRGMGSRHYDYEGIAAKKRSIVEKGILKSYYVDNYYGKKMGMTPNSGSSSNLIMSYGDKSMKEMIRGIKKGIFVWSFIGGNSNPTTGDFSFGVQGAYVENGKILQPVNEMNITGNLDSLFKNLAGVGNDPYVYSSWRLPTLHFRDVSFSGL